MTMLRSTLRTLSFAIPLLAAAAPALLAQNRTLFTWTGRVDREVQISMRGRDVWTNSGDGGRSRVRVESMLPRTDGYVRVEARDGRGEVSVVQQPASWQGWGRRKWRVGSIQGLRRVSGRFGFESTFGSCIMPFIGWPSGDNTFPRIDVSISNKKSISLWFPALKLSGKPFE